MSNDNKKKGGLKSAIFGNRPSGDIVYRIIYMTLTCFVTEKGPEQVAMILYGDDQEAIFTTTMPAGALMYSYKDDIDGPFIKVSKSFLPGSSRAEIWLPKGYSFMAPSVPAIAPVIAPTIAETITPDIVKAMPKQQITYMPAPTSSRANQIELEDLPEPEMSTDDVIQMVNENEAKAREAMAEREARGEVFDEALFGTKQEQEEHQPAVIVDGDTFSATFDEDILNERINKFLAKREEKPVVETAKPKEVDPRTIEEVKRESVDEEMERLFKNDEQMRKIKEAADNDAGKKDR